MKGAEETLRQKSGNDCDQAALLTALLRASGFPTRYVRGTIQFFPNIDRAKNLTGIDDTAKIAEYFRKAGIPYKSIIQGGKIGDIQIEHIWVESQIPYSNYRGNVIDGYGKIWLGLDTSIKVKGYTYNSAQDILSEMSLTTIRDEYLGLITTDTPSTPFELNQTPLEYLQSRINAELQTQDSQLAYADFLRTRTLIPEVLNILPASVQFTLVQATNEYTAIPDDLKHTVRFTATDTADNPLFDITQDAMKLSNQRIAVTYEPETVQDQEIIDSYGGLDNTPAYLVSLRPVLTVNGERMIVAQNGLAMGSDYTLAVDIVSPGGTESITNTHIAGNLSVIGLTAGKAVQSDVQNEMDAESMLYETTQHYIDRWNKSEEDLASLLHLTIARPIPTVVTLGNVVDVAYLMGVPHGFTWKGAFIDAGLRRIEAVRRAESGVGSEGEREKLFMQLSSLQGSALEHRIFEDDWQAPGISTAKLIQLDNQASGVGGQGAGQLSIDKTNINAVLPTLSVDDAIKEDITNAVNQKLAIRIPKSEISYQDWTGIGYIKENPDTGESGWMLSGSIAGGMTAVSPDKWTSQDYETVLSNPYNDDTRNITITFPANETTVNTPAVTVTGTVTDPEATVTVNGVPAIVEGTEFTVAITLTSGTNTIKATATNKAGKTSFDMIVIRYKIPLAIAITYPFEGADLAMSPIYVEGFASDPAASLYVSGIKVQPESDGHFLANGVQLAEGSNQIIASAMNTDGELSSQTISVNYHAPQTQPSLSVSITSPTSGGTVNKPATTVIGTITSTADEVWVIVNGMPAAIYGNEFVVNNVPLMNGSNRIVVNAMDSNGGMARAERTASTNAAVPYAQLRANMTSGIAPLATYFSIESSISNTIASYQIDFEGRETVDYTGATFDNITHIYTTEGIYYPTVTVTDSMGNSYTDSAIITVQSKAAIEASLAQKWNRMKTALSAGNIDDAVQYFADESKDAFRKTFTSYAQYIPQAIAGMGEFNLINVTGHIAECDMRSVFNGITYSFPVFFVRDGYGKWKIMSF